MGRILLELSDNLVQALKVPESEAVERLSRELAVRLYQKRLASFGKAREIARMTAWEFHDLLAAEGIERTYDVEELRKDIMTIERIEGTQYEGGK